MNKVMFNYYFFYDQSS